MNDKSEKCIFVGYSERSKAYKLYNHITKKLVISRDVKFNEEKAWNWSTNDPKGKSICVDMEEEKQIQHDDEEVHTPPYSPHSSSSSSSSSTSSPTNSSSPRKTKSLKEIYEDSIKHLNEDLMNFTLFADADPFLLKMLQKKRSGGML